MKRTQLEVMNDIVNLMFDLVDMTGVDDTGIPVIGIYTIEGDQSYGPAEEHLSALIMALVDLRSELQEADPDEDIQFTLDPDREDDPGDDEE